MEDSKIKKSVALSGLVSTGGLFVAKMIGLLYTIPFSYILSNDIFSAIYGSAYAIYSYILNVFTAGFPFAISSLIAKYTELGNSKNVLAIRKMAIRFLAVLGLCGMLVMAVLSPILSPAIAVSYPDYTSVVRNVLLILSLAILLVPILSAFRGFIQGRKEMSEYAFSQMFEQIFRVGFLLSAALLVIYVLHTDRVWALYGAVASTSVAAVAAILQCMHFERRLLKTVEAEAEVQTEPETDFRKLFREFFSISIPFLIAAILGYADDIYYSVLVPIGMNNYHYTAQQIATINSTINFSGSKLRSIPMILAPGFTSALIPHISAALSTGNMKLVRRNVLECLNIVTFLAIPVAFCIFLYARPICNILFYTDDLDTAVSVTRWIALEGLTGAITPVVSNLLMTLQERKYALKHLTIATIAKGILMIPAIMLIGFSGAILTSALASAYIIGTSLWKIHRDYKVRFRNYFRRVFMTILCAGGMWAVSAALNIIGLDGMASSKLIGFVQMCGNGLITVLVFVGLALLFHLPQSIFHLRLERFLGPKE